jgi:hypothetical protein
MSIIGLAHSRQHHPAPQDRHPDSPRPPTHNAADERGSATAREFRTNLTRKRSASLTLVPSAMIIRTDALSGGNERVLLRRTTGAGCYRLGGGIAAWNGTSPLIAADPSWPASVQTFGRARVDRGDSGTDRRELTYALNESGVIHSGRGVGSAFFLSGAAVMALAWLRAARKRCWAPCLVSP